jgi:hypothetical protein
MTFLGSRAVFVQLRAEETKERRHGIDLVEGHLVSNASNKAHDRRAGRSLTIAAQAESRPLGIDLCGAGSNRAGRHINFVRCGETPLLEGENPRRKAIIDDSTGDTSSLHLPDYPRFARAEKLRVVNDHGKIPECLIWIKLHRVPCDSSKHLKGA